MDVMDNTETEILHSILSSLKKIEQNNVKKFLLDIKLYRVITHTLVFQKLLKFKNI